MNYASAEQLIKLNQSILRSDFNCFSFAVGNYFSWMVPQKYRSMMRDNAKAFPQLIIEEFETNEMLKDSFKSVGVIDKDIKREDFQLGKEYIIARLAEGYDFHFVRRLADGTYIHKRGRSPIHEISEDEVFSDSWIGGYDSQMVAFVRIAEEPFEEQIEKSVNATEEDKPPCMCEGCRRARGEIKESEENVDNNNNNNNGPGSFLRFLMSMMDNE